MDLGPYKPPPVKTSPMVKSLGWAFRVGANGGLAVARANKAAMSEPGLWAMLMAAVAVSVAVVPVDPPLMALAKSVEQPLEVGLFVLTQAARMSARVLIVFCGTVPLLTPLTGGVAASAVPAESVSRLVTSAKALEMPVCASVVPELETCSASVAKPANAYAVAMLETSFTDR